MADIGSMSMVSYYQPLGLYRQQQQVAGQQQLAQQVQQQSQAQQAQQHASTSSPDGPQQYWYGYPHGYPHAAHHHQSSGSQQYLDHPDAFPGWPHHHAHHYSHLQYHQAYHPQQQQSSQISGVTADWSGDEGNPVVVAGEPSPPITVSGSEISNPGTPTTPTSSNNNSSNNSSSASITINNNTINSNVNNNSNATPMRPVQVRSPYEWMKKSSYQSQPHPACNITANCNENSGQAIHENCIIDALGKTRTKDKYRVVYTDHQRLELEKEFHYNRYITMRRKAELAGNLGLSERQVKIWFQNRRAKQRKQAKKREELEHKDVKPIDALTNSAMAAMNLDGIPHNAMAALNLGGMGGMSGMGGMHNGMMHNDGSPPHGMGRQPHPLALTHAASSLHQQHAHPHTVLGL